MSVLSDQQIIDRCKKQSLIEPFFENSVKKDDQGKGILSYGVSSYGYDLRIADEFQVFQPNNEEILDPKDFKTDTTKVTHVSGQGFCVIPPNSFILCRTLEKITMPRDCVGIVLGKSTYARCGLVCNTTPIEPEWVGYITIEISNTTPVPVKFYANEGGAQIVFHKADEICKTSYNDKKGKYQNQQAEVTNSKV